MKRALIAGSLLAAIALGAAAPCTGQPVAKLEVVKKELTQHQKLDLIRGQLDQVLELLRVTPPRPPVVDPQPPKPVEPTPPVTPTEPAKPNPFVAWREQGLSLVEVSMWRLGRGLTAAELEQAYVAGYQRPSAPAGGPAAPSRESFELTPENGYLVHPTVAAGVPHAFRIQPGSSGRVIRVFGVSGDEVNEVNGMRVIGGADLPYDPAAAEVVITANGVGRNPGTLRLGVQLQ